jgi:predicted esterase YcpF (UPF0227 family)
VKVIYLHGFRSSPASRKASQLRARFAALGRSHDYLCPQLPVSPREAAALVQETAAGIARDDIALIGSSLGGYYATWLAERIGCRAVLLNPAIAPARDLADYIGRQPVYFSTDAIEFRPEHLDELRALDTPRVTRPERYFLVAATGDALIDYRTMVAKYRGARHHIIEGSDHELSDFGRVIDEVLDFCGIGLTTRGMA